MDIPGDIIAGIALILSLPALWFSYKAYKLAQEANKVSKSANQLAQEANDLTKAEQEANKENAVREEDEKIKSLKEIIKNFVETSSTFNYSGTILFNNPSDFEDWLGQKLKDTTDPREIEILKLSEKYLYTIYKRETSPQNVADTLDKLKEL